MYEPPVPSKIGDLTHIRWNGLLPPPFIDQVLTAVSYVFLSLDAFYEAYRPCLSHVEKNHLWRWWDTLFLLLLSLSRHPRIGGQLREHPGVNRRTHGPWFYPRPLMAQRELGCWQKQLVNGMLDGDRFCSRFVRYTSSNETLLPVV